MKAYAPSLYPRVRVMEATINQPVSEIAERITALNPSVIGFSCYIWNIDRTLELCRMLKQSLPDTILMLGGPEVSYCAKAVFKEQKQIDYILKGEGEESVPEFFMSLFIKEQDKPLPCPADQRISGLCMRRSDGTILENESVPLQKIPPSPITAGYAEALEGRIAYIESSRGCPYSCAFCLSGRNDRLRVFPLENAFSDLLALANAKTQTVKFVDRTFNADAAHCNALLTFILQNYGTRIPHGICFHFEIAGDILREDTLRLLEKMPRGAVQLEIGMQSFSEKTLEKIRRKTDTFKLQNNIRRLAAMKNIHIHIDLIAGLPYEDMRSFERSFNLGYALGAHVMQLGFLKLLHGSAMRNDRENYPCDFEKRAPYQVQSTPWLSTEDMARLHELEDALERAYNSGRFFLTLDYAINESGLSPFLFYSRLGAAAREAGINVQSSLDEYTALLRQFCDSLPNTDAEKTRDMLLRDRLSTNSSRQTPPCLHRKDVRLAKAVRWLAENKNTAPENGVRRNAALLYAARTLCYVDYKEELKDPVSGRWPCKEIPWDSLPI